MCVTVLTQILMYVSHGPHLRTYLYVNVCVTVLTCAYLSRSPHLHVSVNVCDTVLTCAYAPHGPHLCVYVNVYDKVFTCDPVLTCACTYLCARV